MKKRKLNLDLEIRKLTKAVMKGDYGQCGGGRDGGNCRCGEDKAHDY